MHPQIQQFIEQFEREARMNGSYRNKLGKFELLFLEGVWGPAFQYNFSGLKAEYPLKDFKGGQRFVDFVFIKQNIRLLVEIDGFTTHARDISPGDFDDHLTRQNDLILAGWLLLRFSSNQVEKRTQICQRQIMQAIGHRWMLTQRAAPSPTHTHIWTIRKDQIIQMANRNYGVIKPSEVAAEFEISNRTAAEWLKRFADEGVLLASSDTRIRTMSYRVVGYSD
jgi:very-short-patch-repair endonuclease